MKVAVLISGQPRNLEQGAWWFKNRVFPSNSYLHIDYYCHFWNNNETDLINRIKNSYDPKGMWIEDYSDYSDNLIHRIRDYNTKNPDWDNIPDNYKNGVLFNGSHVSKYCYNFWGQYLSANRITRCVENLNEYDIVIKTRSDIAFKPMDLKYWVQAFNNIKNNPAFRDKVFSNWLFVKSGIPYMGDFAFISTPVIWKNFADNLDENCYKLATSHKFLWNELNLIDDIMVPHWVWNKTSLFSKTNWLSFSVAWPMPFDSTLIRYPEQKIEIANYDYLKRRFDQYAVEEASSRF